MCLIIHGLGLVTKVMKFLMKLFRLKKSFYKTAKPNDHPQSPLPLRDKCSLLEGIIHGVVFRSKTSPFFTMDICRLKGRLGGQRGESCYCYDVAVNPTLQKLLSALTPIKYFVDPKSCNSLLSR